MGSESYINYINYINNLYEYFWPERKPQLPNPIRAEEATEKAGRHVVNEDCILNEKEKNLYGVFDGLGGHENGHLASELASETIKEFFLKEDLLTVSSSNEAENLCAKALMNAHNAINYKNQDEGMNMQTTGSIGFFWPDKEEEDTYYFTYGNVGDSRIYLFDGELKQLTLDDGHVRNEFIDDKGQFDEKGALDLQSKFNNIPDPKELTDDELRIFNKRNKVSQSLGHKKIQPIPRTGTIKMQKGNCILICSDGLTDTLTSDQIQRILKQSPNNKEAVEKLIKYTIGQIDNSLNPRRKDDDVTAILIEFDKEPVEHLVKKASDIDDPKSKFYTEVEEVFQERYTLLVNLSGNFSEEPSEETKRKAELLKNIGYDDWEIMNNEDWQIWGHEGWKIGGYNEEKDIIHIYKTIYEDTQYGKTKNAVIKFEDIEEPT